MGAFRPVRRDVDRRTAWCGSRRWHWAGVLAAACLCLAVVVGGLRAVKARVGERILSAVPATSSSDDGWVAALVVWRSPDPSQRVWQEVTLLAPDGQVGVRRQGIAPGPWLPGGRTCVARRRPSLWRRPEIAEWDTAMDRLAPLYRPDRGFLEDPVCISHDGRLLATTQLAYGRWPSDGAGRSIRPVVVVREMSTGRDIVSRSYSWGSPALLIGSEPYLLYVRPESGDGETLSALNLQTGVETSVSTGGPTAIAHQPPGLDGTAYVTVASSDGSHRLLRLRLTDLSLQTVCALSNAGAEAWVSPSGQEIAVSDCDFVSVRRTTSGALMRRIPGFCRGWQLGNVLVESYATSSPSEPDGSYRVHLSAIDPDSGRCAWRFPASAPGTQPTSAGTGTRAPDGTGRPGTRGGH
jgi:hypothetical protein